MRINIPYGDACVIHLVLNHLPDLCLLSDKHESQDIIFRNGNCTCDSNFNRRSFDGTLLCPPQADVERAATIWPKPIRSTS